MVVDAKMVMHGVLRGATSCRLNLLDYTERRINLQYQVTGCCSDTGTLPKLVRFCRGNLDSTVLAGDNHAVSCLQQRDRDRVRRFEETAKVRTEFGTAIVSLDCTASPSALPLFQWDLLSHKISLCWKWAFYRFVSCLVASSCGGGVYDIIAFCWCFQVEVTWCFWLGLFVLRGWAMSTAVVLNLSYPRTPIRKLIGLGTTILRHGSWKTPLTV